MRLAAANEVAMLQSDLAELGLLGAPNVQKSIEYF